MASTQYLTTAIDFSYLARLDMDDCDGNENLLRSLTKSFKFGPYALTDFQLRASGVDGQVLFDFFTSFEGLQRLRIGATYTIHDFDTSCLHGHRKTLEEFALVGQEGSFGTDNGGIRALITPAARFAGNCPRMEALGLMLPNITTNASDPEEMERFDDTLLQLLMLPNLQLLRIYNWPEYHGTFVKDEVAQNVARFFPAMENFVASLFQRMKARGIEDFPIVYFGAETWSYVCNSELAYLTPGVRYQYRNSRVYGELPSKPVRWSQDELEAAFPDCVLATFMS